MGSCNASIWSISLSWLGSCSAYIYIYIHIQYLLIVCMHRDNWMGKNGTRTSTTGRTRTVFSMLGVAYRSRCHQQMKRYCSQCVSWDVTNKHRDMLFMRLRKCSQYIIHLIVFWGLYCFLQRWMVYCSASSNDTHCGHLWLGRSWMLKHPNPVVHKPWGEFNFNNQRTKKWTGSFQEHGFVWRYCIHLYPIVSYCIPKSTSLSSFSLQQYIAWTDEAHNQTNV